MRLAHNYNIEDVFEDALRALPGLWSLHSAHRYSRSREPRWAHRHPFHAARPALCMLPADRRHSLPAACVLTISSILWTRRPGSLFRRGRETLRLSAPAPALLRAICSAVSARHTLPSVHLSPPSARPGSRRLSLSSALMCDWVMRNGQPHTKLAFQFVYHGTVPDIGHTPCTGADR